MLQENFFGIFLGLIEIMLLHRVYTRCERRVATFQNQITVVIINRAVYNGSNVFG